MRLILDDFWGAEVERPVYEERYSESRFRVPRVVLMGLYKTLKDRPCWNHGVNANGIARSHPMQTLASDTRVLASGEVTYFVDEYVRPSSCTLKIAMKKLSTFLIDEHGPVYLRPPSDAELDTMLKRNAERGLPP